MRSHVPLHSRCILVALLAHAVAEPAGAGSQGPDTAKPDGLSLLADRVDYRIDLRHETALGTRDGRAHKSEVIVQPELEIELPWDLSFQSVLRMRFDGFDRLEPGRPSQATRSVLDKRLLIGSNIDFEIRELHIDGRVGSLLFTLGKQHIVWGKADGLKVLDIVNPQTFREFILPDFDDSRITLWALNVEVPVGSVAAQIVWLPDPTFHEIPADGGRFEPTSPLVVPPLPAGATVGSSSTDRPRNLVLDSDAGIRLSTFFRGWDLTLNYLYAYDDFGVPFRVIAPGPIVDFERGYERTHLIGGTFSNAFGDLTIRGELGYQTQRFYAVDDFTDADGVARTGELRYVLGFDWYGLRDTLLSFQLFQTWRSSYDRRLLVDELNTRTTFVARRTFLHETLLAQLTVIVDLNRGDGLVRPKLTYDVLDDLRAWLGFDVFFGKSRGVFGQYDSRDRLVLGIEWTL